MEYIENVIEWVAGEKIASLTLTSKKQKNRIRKLHEEYPDEFLDYFENSNGAVYARIPLEWVKISHPRKMSDEQKEIARQRLITLRALNFNSETLDTEIDEEDLDLEVEEIQNEE